MGPRPRALVLDRVTKRFSRGGRTIEVVGEVSFALDEGALVGLLGENGAGKTTLLRMIAGLVEPSTGRIFVRGRELGRAVGALQRDVGWCSSDERSFYPRLSGLENLRLFGALHGLDRAATRARIRALGERFGLAGALEQPFQACSTGQRQRLNLARALLHEPALLLLDEPARSLDSATRAVLVEVLREHAAQPGKLVLVASHDLEGLESLWSEVLVLRAGRLVHAGPIGELAHGGELTHGGDLAHGDGGWEVLFRTHAARETALLRHASLRAGGAPELAVCSAVDGEVPAVLLACATASGRDVVRFERRSHPSLRARLVEIARAEVPGPGATSDASVAQPPQEAPSAPRGGSAPDARRSAAAPSRAAGSPARQAPPAALATSSAADELPSAPLRPRAPALRAALALARRDRLVYLSHHFQTGLKLALLVVWIATLYFVSALVDTRSPQVAQHLSGDYFTYALIGLAGLRISQVCLVQMASALREEQLQGTVEPLIATGQPPLLLLLGGLLWPLLSDVAGLLVVFGAAGLLLGADLSAANLPALVVAGVATVLASAVWGVLSASFVIAFKRGDPVTLLFNLVTIGLSGVFFPVELIPEWLRPFSRVLPLTWGLEAVRAAALRGAGFTSGEYLRALAGLGVLILVVAPLAAFAYRSAVAHARRTGSLAQS